MAGTVHITYHCPHCKADITPLARISWAEVAPCPECGKPVQRSRGAFATNCAPCFTLYAWLVLLVPVGWYVFTQVSDMGVGSKLLIWPMGALLASAPVGLLAMVIGYMIADHRPHKAETASGKAGGRLVRCVHCNK